MKDIDEEHFKRSISDKVKELRKTSQEALAANAKISEDTISRIERGTSIINSLTLIKLCNALNVTPNDILEDFIDVNPVNNELNKGILKLSDEEKESLLTITNLYNRNKK